MSTDKLGWNQQELTILVYFKKEKTIKHPCQTSERLAVIDHDQGMKNTVDLAGGKKQDPFNILFHFTGSCHNLWTPLQHTTQSSMFTSDL